MKSTNLMKKKLENKQRASNPQINIFIIYKIPFVWEARAVLESSKLTLGTAFFMLNKS